MKRVYTTANGRRINLDAIISQNEESIAVGNMKTNARGDELGPGGKIERKRNEVMSEYYKLNTPVATDDVPRSHKKTVQKDLTDDWIEPFDPFVTDEQITKPFVQSAVVESAESEVEPVIEPKAKLRGSLAGSVAKTQAVNPADAPKKIGPSRI
jgi:hypothetical protein